MLRFLTLILFLSTAVLSQNTLSTPSAGAHPDPLIARRPVTFLLEPGQSKNFELRMKTDDFAEITWLANDDVQVIFEIFDSLNRSLHRVDSDERDSLVFIAPSEGAYKVSVRVGSQRKVSESYRVSIEYNSSFALPAGSKQTDIRRINGYDVRILKTPLRGTEGPDSVVLVQKAGKVKKILKELGDGDIAGFYFADNISKAYSAADKRSIPLIASTSDKTGDGIPDVLLHYYSGGAHCCASSYFLNLGEKVDLVDSISTGHDSIIALAKNPKGGLFFSVSDTSYAYWQIGFAGSAFPNVILHFVNGKLRPALDRMKKGPPSLTTLNTKARATKNLLSLSPYLDTEVGESELYKEDANFQTGFWSELLDLIYSGNEPLAWQYLDLVWPPQKAGKEYFIRDIKKRMAESPFWVQMEEESKRPN